MTISGDEKIMTEYFITLVITFAVIIVFAFFFTFCRRQLRKTPHGLTGMCHKNGGAMCSSCQDLSKKNTPDS